MADTTAAASSDPPKKKGRLLFKRRAPKKPRAEDDDETGLSIFSHSKTMYDRVAEEAEQRAKEQAEKNAAKEVKEQKAGENERVQKRSSSVISSDEGEQGEGSVNHENSSLHVDSSLSRADNDSPPKRRKAAIVDDSDDDENTTSSPSHAIRPNAAAPSTSGAIRDNDADLSSRNYWTTTHSSSVAPITIDDEDSDSDVLEIKANPNDSLKPPEGVEDDPDADLDPETRAAIEAVRQRRAAEKDPKSAPVVNILVVSDIPGTTSLVARRRINQGLGLVKLTWLSRQQPGLTEADVLLTWKGQRIYSTTTCENLGIRVDGSGVAMAAAADTRFDMEGFTSDGKVVLEAMTPELLAQFERRKEIERKQKYGIFDDEDDEFLRGEGSNMRDEEPEEGKVKKIRVCLTPRQGEELKLTVRPETTVAEMVESFRKGRGVDESRNVWLQFDGDRLEEDQTVEEVDIDDLDRVEVYVQ